MGVTRYDILIVGGSAAGYTAALTAKKLYPDKKVLMIRAVGKPPIPCAIPYLAATIEACDRNLLPDKPLKDLGVEVVEDRVTEIDRSSKVVRTASGASYGYDKLILATGALPFVPPSIKGADLEGVYTIIKDYNVLMKLQEAIRRAEKIVIVGGGFIGVELADDLSNLQGKKVTIVEMLPHCLLLNLDEEFAVEAEERLKAKGVEIITGKAVRSIYGSGKAEGVELSDGTRIPADVVVICVGVKPNVELASRAGLKIGESGAIAVDEYMRTSDPDIFAIGDCAEKRSFFTGKPKPLYLASVACHEARVAVFNLYGLRMMKSSSGYVGAFLTVIGGRAFGVAGLTEREAKREGLDVVVGSAEVPNRHPGLLPGATKTRIKLIFAKDSGTLVGAEASGGPEVAELTNLLALAVQTRSTVTDLLTLQYGTQPMLTASPVSYYVVAAAFNAYLKLKGS